MEQEGRCVFKLPDGWFDRERMVAAVKDLNSGINTGLGGGVFVLTSNENTTRRMFMSGLMMCSPPGLRVAHVVFDDNERILLVTAFCNWYVWLSEKEEQLKLSTTLVVMNGGERFILSHKDIDSGNVVGTTEWWVCKAALPKDVDVPFDLIVCHDKDPVNATKLDTVKMMPFFYKEIIPLLMQQRKGSVILCPRTDVLSCINLLEYCGVANVFNEMINLQ